MSRITGKQPITKQERLAYRTAARIFLDITELVSGDLSSNVGCAFVGAYVYMMDMPVSIYNISKTPFCGSYRTARRHVDRMEAIGALSYNEDGLVVCTAKGRQNSEWFFKQIFEMQTKVDSMMLKNEEAAE